MWRGEAESWLTCSRDEQVTYAAQEMGSATASIINVVDIEAVRSLSSESVFITLNCDPQSTS